MTLPLALGAMALVGLKSEFPGKISRVSAQERARKIREIRTSGPLQTEFSCSGRIGLVSFNGGLAKVTIYPAGLICRIQFVSEFGISSSEIENVGKHDYFFRSGIRIVHHSPNVVSPILLRPRDAAAVAALLALKN